MKMMKKQYRIGDLAKHLKVEKFVVRFWEKELGIKAKRSKGGQRFYQEKDFQTFSKIKELLYEKKYTIAGAKEELARLHTSKKTQTVIASQKPMSKKEHEKLMHLKNQLIKLKACL